MASSRKAHWGRVGTGLHDEGVMLLVSRVTAPVLASARPMMFAPVVAVMLVSARMLPANEVAVPSVAELPTCQNTLHWLPLLLITTDDPLAVVSVLPNLKMNTAAALPCALRVNVPVSAPDVAKQ